MPKRTIALILVLIAITAGLVLLSVSNLKGPSSPQIIPGKEQVATYAKTTLAISPTATKVTGENLYEVPVMIESTNKVSAVQLELVYDPKAISAVDVVVGDYFKNPTVLLKKIDEKTGRITYAFGLGLGQDTVTGAGTVAKIRFSPNPGFRTTQINFLPKTQVSAIDQRKSVLKSSTSAVINLEALSTEGNSITPSATTSGR
ncbi:cohesin domain-containing protein [Patescibacteria group bacterium]|nr:cohesin domain-containing protein [Patescibacteria group bacterium]